MPKCIVISNLPSALQIAGRAGTIKSMYTCILCILCSIHVCYVDLLYSCISCTFIVNYVYMYVMYICVCMNNHVHRAPFLDIERKKEVAKSKEQRKEIYTFINH